jgi:hypothetical protein
MGCSAALNRKHGVSQCPRCQGYYCIDCDLFVHEVLNTCPGCCLLPSRQHAGSGPEVMEH